MNVEQARAEAKEAREEMDGAIRAYADALWKLQDVLSDDDKPSDNVLGDTMIVAHFTPMDRMARDNFGDYMVSPQYVLLNPRELAPHALHGLAMAAQTLIDEETEIVLGAMYGEDDAEDI